MTFVFCQAHPRPYSPRIHSPSTPLVFFPPSLPSNSSTGLGQPPAVTVSNGSAASTAVLHAKPIIVGSTAEVRRSPQLPPYPDQIMHISSAVHPLPQSHSSHAMYFNRPVPPQSLPLPQIGAKAPSPTVIPQAHQQYMPLSPLAKGLLTNGLEQEKASKHTNGEHAVLTSDRIVGGSGTDESTRKDQENNGVHEADTAMQKQMVSHAQFRAALSVSIDHYRLIGT